MFLPVATGHVREFGSACKLTKDELDLLGLAAEEACANSIEHAYESTETGFFQLTLDIDAESITLSLFDHGLPFDYSLAPKYVPPSSGNLDDASTKGLGLYLIEQVMDSVEWVNHGSDGKELRLCKKRDAPEGFGPSRPEPDRVDPPPVVADNQSYTARRMLPEDAIKAAQCIYRTYGYTYEDDKVYMPERLVELNKSGQLLSVVGLDSSGDVVGYTAFKRPDLGPIGEFGQAVVNPAHRGRSVLAVMTFALTAEVYKLGLIGVYASPTTIHPFSQKAADRGGLNTSAITLGCIPKERIYKGEEMENHSERKSLTLCFSYMTPPPPSVAYVPARHHAILEKIYGLLRTRHELSDSRAIADRPGRVATAYNKGAKTATITVHDAGVDTIAEVRRAFRDLIDIVKVEAVYLRLSVAQASTPALCDAAEELGFFFSGVLPQFAKDGDYLQLQYLVSPLDRAHLKLFSPFTQELGDYIFSDWKRVRGDNA